MLPQATTGPRGNAFDSATPNITKYANYIFLWSFKNPAQNENSTHMGKYASTPPQSMQSHPAHKIWHNTNDTKWHTWVNEHLRPPTMLCRMWHKQITEKKLIRHRHTKWHKTAHMGKWAFTPHKVCCVGCGTQKYDKHNLTQNDTHEQMNSFSQQK